MFDWLKNLFGGGSKNNSGSGGGSTNVTQSRPYQQRSNSLDLGQLGDQSSVNNDDIAQRRAEEAAAAEAERKRKEEEEKKREAERKKQEEERAAQAAAKQAEFQQRLQSPRGTLSVNGQNPFMLPNQMQKAAPVDNRNDKQKTLDRLAAENLAEQKAKLEKADDASMKKSGFLDKLFYNLGGKHDLNKRAEIAAQNKASQVYQEKNGYNGDKDVLDFNKRTSARASRNSQDAGQAIENTKKTVDAMRWLPGAGAGELGANLLRSSPVGKLLGVELNDDIMLQEQTGMTPQQIKSLTPEERNKYLMISKAGLGAGVFDFVGVGAAGLVKNIGKNSLKKSTLTGLSKEIASKQGAKMLAKNTAVGSGAGAVIGGGGTAALGGDKEEIIQNSLTGGIAGAFGGAAQSPFDSAVKLTKTGRNAGKNARLSQNLLEGEAIDNIDASGKVNLTKVGTDEIQPNTPDETARIPTVVKDSEPAENKVEVAPGFKTSASNETSTPARRMEKAQEAQQIEQMRQATLPQAGGNKSIMPETSADPVRIPDPTSPMTLAKAVEGADDNAVPIAQFSDAVDGSQPLQRATPVDIPQTTDAAATVPPTVADAAEAAAQGELRLPTGAVDATGNQTLQSDVQTQQELLDMGIAPQRGDSTVASQEDQMQQAAEQVAREQVDGIDAPNTREAAITQNITDEALADDLRQNAPRGESVSLEDAEMQAKQVLNQLDDSQLVMRFNEDFGIQDPRAFFTALNGIRRLERVNTPEADSAIKNALDAMTEYSAASGRGLRTVQVVFENLPKAMKVDYLMRKLPGAGADMQDVDRARLISLIENADDAMSNARGLEEQAKMMLDNGSITNGNVSPEVINQVKSLRDDIQFATRQKEAAQGEAYKMWRDNLGKTPTGKQVGDIGRTLMLSSPGGRVFDLISTSSTLVSDTLDRNLSSLIGKGYNAVKGAGSVEDTLTNASEFGRGTAEGAQRTKAAFQGKDFVEDFEGEARRATRGDVDNGGSFIRKGIRAAVEMPTNLTRGVRNDEVYRQGMQEAAQLGLEGDARSTYAMLRSAVPTDAQIKKATDSHMRVNMLHDNAISRKINGFARSLDENGSASWLSPLLRNQIAPFTSWLGGNLNRALTDKNMLWNAYKIADNAVKGNPQGVIDDVSKLTVNSAQAYAVGAVLTQAGVITDTDANGDDYAGLYFHIGDRYIPVAAAGAAATPIIFGNAVQKGMDSEDFVEGLNNALDSNVTNFIKNAGISGVLGGDNPLQKTVVDLANGDSSAVDAAAQYGGNLLRQYIPSVTGDINAGLDMTALNPTGEDANTRVEDEDGKKNVLATEGSKILDRIPFLSQTLDRREGVAAKDLLDRGLRSTHETDASRDARSVEAGKLDLKERRAQLEDQGVPVTATDIENVAKDGNYDAAIQGAQYRLEELKADPDTPKRHIESAKQDIEEYKLQKDGVPLTDEARKARMEEGEYGKVVKGLQYDYDQIKDDPDVSKAKKADAKDEIKRVELYRDEKYEPELVSSYEASKNSGNYLGITAWTDMMESGDPKLVAAAEKLQDLDDKLFEAGLIDEKRYVSKRKGGRGRRGGRGRGGSGSSKPPALNFNVGSNKIAFSPQRLKKQAATFAVQKTGLPQVAPRGNTRAAQSKKIKVTRGRSI